MLANEDLDALSKNLQIGLTPVIISEQIEWLSLDDWKAERNALNAEIEDWRRDWESRDTERYLTHYSKKFSADHENLAHGGDTSARSTPARPGSRSNSRISACSAIRAKTNWWSSPSSRTTARNNLSNVMKKRQYWTKEGGHWRIIYEGAA